jgi:hypothetical protein
LAGALEVLADIAVQVPREGAENSVKY